MLNSQIASPAPDISGFASMVTWDMGNMVYAHNYLEGSEFYGAENMTVIYPDGTTERMEIKNREIFTGQDWEKFLTSNSSVDSLTLVTCYPRSGITSWRYLVEMQKEEEVRYGSRI